MKNKTTTWTIVFWIVLVLCSMQYLFLTLPNITKVEGGGLGLFIGSITPNSIIVLIFWFIKKRSEKNTAIQNNEQSENLHLKERYKELIRAFDDYDLYNKPIVLRDELNMFKMGWVGQTIKSDFWFNEVNRTLIVKYTLEYNTEALSKNGIKVEELPDINQELNWKFDIDTMGQIQMYSIISTDLKAKMDKV